MGTKSIGLALIVLGTLCLMDKMIYVGGGMFVVGIALNRFGRNW